MTYAAEIRQLCKYYCKWMFCRCSQRILVTSQRWLQHRCPSNQRLSLKLWFRHQLTTAEAEWNQQYQTCHSFWRSSMGFWISFFLELVNTIFPIEKLIFFYFNVFIFERACSCILFYVSVCLCDPIYFITGTILAGISVLFCGSIRQSGGEKVGVFCTNVWVGILQAILAVFLVGWIWSVIWGIAIISVSGRKSQFYSWKFCKANEIKHLLWEKNAAKTCHPYSFSQHSSLQKQF